MKVKCLQNFTLVELLVVISLLLILISLISPSLNKLSEAMHLNKCKKNLHTMMIGIELYADDNNDSLPGPTKNIFPRFRISNGTGLAARLYPYFGHEKTQRFYHHDTFYIPVLMCPKNTEIDLGSDSDPQSRKHYLASHGIDKPFGKLRQIDPDTGEVSSPMIPPKLRSQISNPSSTLGIKDLPHPNPNLLPQTVHENFQRNNLFLDGSVRSKDMTEHYYNLWNGIN